MDHMNLSRVLKRINKTNDKKNYVDDIPKNYSENNT